MNGDAPRVGYVGLGQMGSAMAGRLLETGVQLIVFDLNPETMAEAVGLGAEPAGSTAEVAAFADVVSICVPDAHHVSSVLDGLGEGAVVGLPVLVHSTIHPDAVAACRMQAALWGGVLHDVCVAGGPLRPRPVNWCCSWEAGPIFPLQRRPYSATTAATSLKQARWVRAPP
jgi:3-hydroxyisobutyrate dehydrogenase-like beta-hydroxyacid dehydrogenase